MKITLMKGSLPRQLRSQSAILLNAASLIGSTVITSGLGGAYWWLATWRFSPEAVGLGSAAVLAMTLLGTFCLFGLGTLLMGELPRQPGQAFSLITTALLVAGVVGGCGGVIFALLAPALSPNFQILRASQLNVVLFAFGVSLTASSLVLDQAMIGLLRGNLQLWRNGAFALIKLAAIYLAGRFFFQKTALTIYSTWTIGNAISCLLLAIVWVAQGGRLNKDCRLRWGWFRKLGPAALQHHLLNIALQLPSLALPVIVAAMLSPAVNARFYIVWMIISIICAVPMALTTALYASASAQPEQIAQKMRLTLALAFGAGILANIVLFVGAERILSVFGHTYTVEAVAAMHILGFGIFPATVMNHFVAVCRVRRRMLAISFPMLAGCLFELTAAALGARFGALVGLCLWWLIARCIETGCMLPTVCAAAWPLGRPSQRQAPLFPVVPRSNSWV